MDQTPCYLVVKQLKKSDLGWFEGPRRELERDGAGRQRSITVHADVLKRIFPPFQLSTKEIALYEYHDTGVGITGPNRRLLQLQGKNWRLGGDMVRDRRFDSLQAGDYMVFLFIKRHDGKCLLAWDTASQADTDLTKVALFERLKDARGTGGMCVVEAHAQSGIIDAWRAAAPKLLQRVLPSTGGRPSSKEAVTERVQRNLMDIYLGTVATLSPLNQQEFADKLSELATVFRDLLGDDILKLQRDHASVWQGVAGKPIGFVDGGTASIAALGTEPMAIRVGTYTVVPGDTSPAREVFEMVPQLVDELFGPDSATRVFTADPDETEVSKLRDMARIGLETAAAVRALSVHPDLAFLFLHGPLVNPVSPYADCPQFSRHGLAQLGVQAVEIRRFVESVMPLAEGQEGNFIAVYRYLLARLFEAAVPVVGVIERSGMSRAVALEVIRQRRGSSRRLHDRVDEIMRSYRISDAMLFAAVLREGEYIRPFMIDKNDLRRASPAWEELIAQYPKPWTTYLMLRETSLPVRVEMTHGQDASLYQTVMHLLYHMALLLPLYAFPVGLDIVDKYAKVPGWMSRQLSRHQASALLKKALASGDLKLYNQVRLMLTQNAREWFLRPKSGGL